MGYGMAGGVGMVSGSRLNFGGDLSEERTGTIARRGLLVNPYGPEIQTSFLLFF